MQESDNGSSPRKARKKRRSRTIAEDEALTAAVLKCGGLTARCVVCGCSAFDRQGRPIAGISIHHVWYAPGTPQYGQFDKRIDYWRALAAYVEAAGEPPETSRRRQREFLVLCRPHHYAIEACLRWPDPAWRAIVEVVRKCKTARHKAAKATKAPIVDSITPSSPGK